MRKISTILALLCPLLAAGQTSLEPSRLPTLTLDSVADVVISDLYATGFVDAYHAVTSGGQARDVTIGHSETGRPTVNYVQFKMQYVGDAVRASAALGAGTFVERLPSAGNPLRFVREAYGGIRLRGNLWLDAGVMPSHLASETPYAMQEATPTRSLVADATPYYQSGSRLSYEAPSGLTVQAHAFNGWQDVADANGSVSYGALVQYKAPSTRITARCAVSIGNERPSGLPRERRRYVDSYARYTASGTVLEARGGLGEEDGRHWHGVTLLARRMLGEHFAVGARAERLRDPGVLYGFAYTANGASLNLDYQPVNNAALRLEGRVIDRQDVNRTTFGLTTTLSVEF